MKTQLIIYPALIAMILLSCEEKPKGTYTEAMKDEVVADGSLAGDVPALDSPEPLGQHELVDTLQLPEPVLIILRKDPATAPDKIKDVRRYNEQGTDYFEITFVEPVNGRDTITYDNLGKIKSPELGEPDR
ncbi:hypothetical protein [Algoriphagus terrigena]|uniref:hypothetical protein n=1 Tax=Algoriphagus terrigena TaxID=344884 RepID=UPI00041BEFC9|nr:hypothetical protein [Algoriphagus terrigena]